jgi:quercetin dioxygenase-like cupin family protein
MFRKGEVYDNPVTGERATIRLGTRETKGLRLVVDLDLRERGFGSPLHLHPGVHERLTVLHGRVGVFLNNKLSIATIGKTLDIPPGVAHRFWNAGSGEARLTIDIQPARRYEAFVRNMIGLAQDGKTDPNGMPNILQFAALTAQFKDVIRFLAPPLMVQGVLFPILLPIATMRGYRGSYSEYLFRSPLPAVERLATQRSKA